MFVVFGVVVKLVFGSDGVAVVPKAKANVLTRLAVPPVTPGAPVWMVVVPA